MSGGTAEVAFVGDDEVPLVADFPPWTELAQNAWRVIVAFDSGPRSWASFPRGPAGQIENVHAAGGRFNAVDPLLARELVKVGHAVPFR